MKFLYFLGGVASSAVIVAMAGVYQAVIQAEAATTPKLEIVQPQVIYLPKPTLPTLHDVVSDTDRECLIHNIYFESRGESTLGQRAVAWVTLNRLFDENFPNTICEVVWQEKQFSWTHDGKSDTPKDMEALSIAEAMADEVLKNYHDRTDPTNGSTYFHSTSVKPAWRRGLDRVVLIDQHIFYKTKDS